MTKLIRVILVAVLAIGGALAGGSALADVDNTCVTGNPPCDNVQEGDNSNDVSQQGSASTGDAVGGQVSGVVSSGDASVDATNESTDIDLESGEATGSNESSQFVGLNSGDIDVTIADVTNVTGASNIQEGDNSYRLSQAVDAMSGDGVGGQVIGTVTSNGGSAAIVAQNESANVDIVTGTADASNDAVAFVGLSTNATPTLTADIDNVGTADNVQEGDNDLQGSQTADAASGDGVGGQVMGIVSNGDASIDASNSSTEIDLETGNATSFNDAVYFVGLNDGDITLTADITNVTTTDNLQEGDNDGVFAQAADAASGDGVAGQVGGVVTSAGGSADLALENSSTDVNATTGSSTFANDDAGFVGLNVGVITLTG